jgi:hypothetical protein
VETLSERTPVLDEELDSTLGLDALGQRGHAEVLREVDHRADHARVVDVLVDAGDERPVDLQDVDRQGRSPRPPGIRRGVQQPPGVDLEWLTSRAGSRVAGRRRSTSFSLR